MMRSFEEFLAEAAKGGRGRTADDELLDPVSEVQEIFSRRDGSRRSLERALDIVIADPNVLDEFEGPDDFVEQFLGSIDEGIINAGSWNSSPDAVGKELARKAVKWTSSVIGKKFETVLKILKKRKPGRILDVYASDWSIANYNSGRAFPPSVFGPLFQVAVVDRASVKNRPNFLAELAELVFWHNQNGLNINVKNCLAKFKELGFPGDPDKIVAKMSSESDPEHRRVRDCSFISYPNLFDITRL